MINVLVKYLVTHIITYFILALGFFDKEQAMGEFKGQVKVWKNM